MNVRRVTFPGIPTPESIPQSVHPDGFARKIAGAGAGRQSFLSEVCMQISDSPRIRSVSIGRNRFRERGPTAVRGQAAMTGSCEFRH
jgi:hypothetical protein